MTQALSAAALAAVIAACWLMGRPRPKILRSTDASAVAALNRSQMELVLNTMNEEPASSAGLGDSTWPLPAPADLRGRRALLAELERQFQAGGLQRQQAMATCLAWRHRDALPLIRRGLRDSNREVAALAAAAMEPFRGRSTVAQALPAKAPRNVSRTR